MLFPFFNPHFLITRLYFIITLPPLHRLSLAIIYVTDFSFTHFLFKHRSVNPSQSLTSTIFTALSSRASPDIAHPSTLMCSLVLPALPSYWLCSSSGLTLRKLSRKWGARTPTHKLLVLTGVWRVWEDGTVFMLIKILTSFWAAEWGKNHEYILILKLLLLFWECRFFYILNRIFTSLLATEWEKIMNLSILKRCGLGVGHLTPCLWCRPHFGYSQAHQVREG